MQCNIGTTDKTIRLVIGAGLIIAAILSKMLLLGVLGAIAVITGYVRFCPAYRLIGFNSNKDNSQT